VFGLCLLNDWSARDVQAWEYQPLGPFLSKSFATTISPWIVTLEALAPYRCAWTRPADDPQPLPYLDAPTLRESGAFDIELEVLIQTAAMREAAARRSASRWATTGMPTGPWRSWSRITPSMAATCGRVTSSVPGPVRSGTGASRFTAGTERWRQGPMTWPMARSASSWKMATPSSCAPWLVAMACPISVSAKRPAPCCRHAAWLDLIVFLEEASA
jgi:hypothetical protein